jgi:hypothetical protein
LHVADHAICMLTCALEYGKVVEPHIGTALSRFLQNGSLEKLENDFLRIMRLERDHAVYASLSKLSLPLFILEETSRLLRDAIASSSCEGASLKRTRVTAAKRACVLLSGDSKAVKDGIWCMAASTVIASLVGELQDVEMIMNLVQDVGLLDASKDSALGQIVVALSFCKAASSDMDSDPSLGMQRIVTASSLLKDWAMVYSSESLTPALVSLSSNFDLVCHILTRADEGMGENIDRRRQALQIKAWQTKMATAPRMTTAKAAVPMCSPKLHPSWYVGDGLLLPPRAALDQSIEFSKVIMFACQGQENATAHLFEFISDRGAHFLALRVLSSWACVHMSQCGLLDDNLDVAALRNGFEGTKWSLAERSLGGSGTGITNAVVDSELAVSFLLSLPIKLAFKTYKACLPTAVKTRNFERLLCLANVGMVSAGGDADLELGASVGWKGQDRFLEQCKKIASRARWSLVLHRHGINVDPQRFDEDKSPGAGNVAASTRQPCQYAASLIPQMIAAFSKTLCPSDVISLSTLYAKAFRLQPDSVVQKLIEFLLSPSVKVVSSGTECAKSIRHCERVARSSLRLLGSAASRYDVLRRCLVALEANPESGLDYERFGLVLTLYQEALVFIVENENDSQDLDFAHFKSELELVDRRRDALTILSSFFQGEKEHGRPSFPTFFIPLDGSSESKPPLCGVLGKRESSAFDPIAPLESTLREFPDSATATSLAPLCLPYGLPTGYIHARSLVVRFSDAGPASNAYPSFDNDIVPVWDRLKSPRDKAILAEWCAEQYEGNDVEKLKCLDLALKSAMLASTEIERRHHQNLNNPQLEVLEVELLEVVRRISATKEALSDRLRVKTILRSSGSSSRGNIERATEALIRTLDNEAHNLLPESLISFLLEEGSLVGAEFCLDNQAGFSIDQLRKFSAVVHEACRAVAEQHSHIHPYHYAKRYARKWLLHGDEMDGESPDSMKQVKAGGTSVKPTQELEGCDDTMDFVMDLADIQGVDDDWGSGVSGSQGAVGADQQLTSEEETSAVKATSVRELSETASQRVGLRISFVLAYHDPSADEEPSGKENSASAGSQPRPSTRKRTGLLSKIDTKRDSEDRILELSKELLGIVFAATGSSSALMDGEKVGGSSAPKTVTFAMRHRAFRAVSVLCPQEVLEQVVRSEGYLSGGPSGGSPTLRRCTFGAMVAKEIEEMGLPLPHDDLGRLSSMHFLSYARTLWRHHRGNDNKRSKGRLLLLLVEMSLKDTETDLAFVESLLQELIRLRLPRTLLLALECIRDFMRRGGTSAVLHELSTQSVLDTVGACIISEAKQLTADGGSHEMDIIVTVERLYQIVFGLSLALNESDYLVKFLEFATKLSIDTEKSSLSSALKGIAAQARRLCVP